MRATILSSLSLPSYYPDWVKPATENTIALVIIVMMLMALNLVYIKVSKGRKVVSSTSSWIGQPAILAIGLAVPNTRAHDTVASNFVDSKPDYPVDARDFFKRVNKRNGIDFRYVDEEFLSSDGLYGFKAPGIELDVVDECKLKGVRRRLGINFMGCFGGFTGMAVAKSFVASEPGAIVLLICAEVCSAHHAVTSDRSKSIGNSIFGDGCAAALFGSGQPGNWVIGNQSTVTLGKDTRDYMTWAPSDSPYDMYLSKNIGKALSGVLFPTVVRTLLNLGYVGVPKNVEWCIHPGGRGLLDTFAEGGAVISGLGRKNLEHSYEILRQYGNMSSPTIFFVIQRMVDEQKKQVECEKKSIAVCIGFGPGLTIEMASLYCILADDSQQTIYKHFSH